MTAAPSAAAAVDTGDTENHSNPAKSSVHNDTRVALLSASSKGG